MIDTFGRKINYARISVTDLCNLRCMYCMPKDGIIKDSRSKILRLEEIITISKALAEIGINKIRLTGGEPLVRNGILKIVGEIGKIGLKDFAMTTNGILLYKFADELYSLGLNRLNISLDTLNPDKFREITRGGEVADVLKGIEVAQKAGFKKIKINAALIKGFNENEIEDLINLTIDNDIDVRFIELMAIGSQSEWALEKYISSDIITKTFQKLEFISNDDPSSPAVYYKLPNAKGRVGVISPISCKFCSNCNRIRITADGKIKNCLHSDEEYDLKPYLSNNNKLKEFLINTIEQKPYSHNLENGLYIKRNMVRIGG